MQFNKGKGVSGVYIFSGYFEEDYLTSIRGQLGADIYDKMRRSDTQIKMILNMIKNPIKSAKWAVCPASEDDMDKEIAEKIEWQLFENTAYPFREMLNNWLSMLDFGYSVNEKIWKRGNDPKWGGDYIGVKDLGLRRQKTIESWNLKDGVLNNVRQRIYNDEAHKDIEIPAKDLIIFTNDKEGSNDWEGMSILRPAYGPWWRKNQYLKLMGIGIEKNAIPTPIGKVPAGKESSEDFTKFERLFKKFTGHQNSYLLFPDGWDVDFLDGKFDPSKIKDAVVYEDTAITKATLASFMELGMEGKGGSYALGSDRSDFFLDSIQFIADYIGDKITNEIIAPMVQVNFGDKYEVPKLKAADINDKAGKELAEILGTLIEKGAILPDLGLEDYIRNRYNLPERAKDLSQIAPVKEETTKTEEKAKEDVEDKEKEKELIELAENRDFTKYEKKANVKAIKRDMEMEEGKLLTMMQNRLNLIAEKAVADLTRGLRNEKDKSKAVNYIKISDASYRKDLDLALNKIAQMGWRHAEKEFPKNNKKLAEQKLPSSLRSKLKLLGTQTTAKQIIELENKIAFAALSAIEQELTDKAIQQEAKKAADTYIKSGIVSRAATTLTPSSINFGRNGFFESVKDQIQAVQFSAVLDDVTTDICRSLDGKTFDLNDPTTKKYVPPLHHNCRSIVVPIPATEPDVEITGAVPNDTWSAEDKKRWADGQQQITLDEEDKPSCDCKE